MQEIPTHDSTAISPSVNRREAMKIVSNTPNADEVAEAPALEPIKPNPPPSSTTLSRSGTLSWQQRPTSRGSGSIRTRPLSVMQADSQDPKPSTSDHSGLTMSQKAQSLEGKDPAWFKQTAERGLNSAAYRKTQESGAEISSASVQLPGLSRQSSAEPERHASPRLATQDTVSSFKDSSSPFSSLGSNSKKSPLPLLSSQRFEPPTGISERGGTSPSADVLASRPLAMSPSQGRLSPERMDRPVSPTKGLGGFVQSAMMKRSDSVNKRWSAQAAAGLTRGNSVASNKGNTDLKSSNISREGTPISLSRPGSSHGLGLGESFIERGKGTSGSPSESPKTQKDHEFAKPDLPGSNSGSPDLPAKPTFAIPPKPIETKKFNPGKPSWLETALNKPESPKPKPWTPQTPAWKLDLQKAKEGKGSVDLGKSPSHREVAVGGLLRSEPMGSGFKSPSLPSISTTSTHGRTGSVSTIRTTNPNPSLPSLSDDAAQSSSNRSEMDEGIDASTTEQSTSIVPAKVSHSSKPKPSTPPKKDFRANLKTRQAVGDKGQENEPEFKNVFGKLKRTETKNYVAPDELKNNILRGKAGLSITGGPKKTERKDEFKESILKKKEEMKAGTSGGRINPSVPDVGNKPVPEAIAKRQGMTTRSESTSTVSDSLTSNTVTRNQTEERSIIGQPRTPEKKASAPGRLQGAKQESNTGLAGRFNTGLASLLARGPPSMATASPRAESPAYTESAEKADRSSDGSQLTHATKSRARGPKRRLPTSNQEPVSQSSKFSAAEEGTSPTSMPTFKSAASLAAKASVPKSLDTTLSKSSSKVTSNNAQMNITSRLEGSDEGPRSKGAQYLGGGITAKTISIPATPKSPPIVKPKPGSEQKLDPQREQSAKSPGGLGPMSAISGRTVSPTTPTKLPKSPPIPAKKSEALARIASNGSLSSPLATQNPISPVPNTTAAANLFRSFFKQRQGSNTKIDIDAQAMLIKASVPTGKIKTLRKEIWELTGDGKKVSIPPQQEHILFESSMYLCTHVFGSPSGKRTTEVYLWRGDDVPASALEDAQLFCRNAAKDAGGKLILLTQGKESSNFFEALGGIVITRRGASSNASSATYMLCGRRHLGQMAFDEVDFSAESLCSGFPFIIAATGGSLYLWKGKGSNADELGCARLIGMDLGLTGEIEEIDEGAEPAIFWKDLRTQNKFVPPESSYYLKGSLEKYNTRLFSINIDARPKSSSSFMWGRRGSTPAPETQDTQIHEVSPFSQSDLTKDGIFVLDTYFEIYM